MVRKCPRIARSVRFSPQENKALELEAMRLDIDVHTLLRAELYPLMRRILRRHAAQVGHLPHGK